MSGRISRRVETIVHLPLDRGAIDNRRISRRVETVNNERLGWIDNESGRISRRVETELAVEVAPLLRGAAVESQEGLKQEGHGGGRQEVGAPGGGRISRRVETLHSAGAYNPHVPVSVESQEGLKPYEERYTTDPE